MVLYKYMRKFLQICAIAIVFLMITVGGVGVVNLSNHTHHTGCPFMPGEQSTCPMNIIDHMSAWNNLFTGNIKFFILLAVSIGTVLYVLQAITYIDIVILILLKNIRKKISHKNILQELFSQGILNPKSP